MDSPIVIACLVFISIYLLWFIIRLFADFFLVAIAMISAVFAYHIQYYYPEILMIMTESNLLEFFNLPAEPNEVAIFKIAGLIIACAVLVSIPILPFSSTYRMMFGVEIPMFYCRKTKIRELIAEEIQRQNEQIQSADEMSKEPIVEVSEESIVEVSKEPIVEISKESIVEVSEEPIVEVSKGPITEVSKEPYVEQKIDKSTKDI